MIRLRRRQLEPVPGDTVVDAVIRARLLGLPLLTLNARVVGRTVDDRLAVLGTVTQRQQHASAPMLPSGRSERDLRRAVELLEQGTRVLEHTRGEGSD